MKYSHLIVRVFAPFINLITLIVNIFIWRDSKIVIMGAWMGNKYADNPRYLFQYLNENKEKYSIKKIVWITRDKDTYNKLDKKKYTVYMMHSLKGIYYHFKAGVYIVCNINFPVKGYSGDLMGQLAGHAIKINTWHGVPLKAGKSTGENIKKEGIFGKLKFELRKNALFLSVFTPGHWDKAYYLSTGKESTRRCSIFCGIDEDKFIQAGYPRDCHINELFDEEFNVINTFGDYSKVFLYVPTFRERGESPYPLSDNRLIQFLNDNNILWIEKPHAAAKGSNSLNSDLKNVLYLDSTFDINVLLDRIDLLITDYSSVCYDAMAYYKPVLYYSPDIEHYKKNERGFLFDYISMVQGFLSQDSDSLLHQLELFIKDEAFVHSLKEKAEYERGRILDKQGESCADIIAAISEKTSVLKIVKVKAK